uniref:Uncharacterized protein TCIL3000_11_9350 n=1 Tax=Trypanosoma congolense (strain IL3000) TaxID=1068625 RepID=G0V1F3_TRYCI|nr:unnamed protein product [Trypanosoma congolense IL3000]
MSLRESGGCDAGEGEYTTNLHVIVIFVVLLASFLGTLIPIIGKYVPALRMPPFVFILGKCIAAGVLLSVATIHMINESVAQLNEDCVPESFRKSYGGYAFLFAVCGALLMHVTDILVDIYVDSANRTMTQAWEMWRPTKQRMPRAPLINMAGTNVITPRRSRCRGFGAFSRRCSWSLP